MVVLVIVLSSVLLLKRFVIIIEEQVIQKKQCYVKVLRLVDNDIVCSDCEDDGEGIASSGDGVVAEEDEIGLVQVAKVSMVRVVSESVNEVFKSSDSESRFSDMRSKFSRFTIFSGNVSRFNRSATKFNDDIARFNHAQFSGGEQSIDESLIDNLDLNDRLCTQLLSELQNIAQFQEESGVTIYNSPIPRELETQIWSHNESSNDDNQDRMTSWIFNSAQPPWCKMQILRIGSQGTRVCPCKFGSKCLGVILDSGASQHITNDRSLLYNVHQVPPVSVQSALKQCSVVKDAGDLAMKLEIIFCLK